MGITRLRFTWEPTTTGSQYKVIDLWREISVFERKLHRQMRVCNVLGGLLQDSNNGTTLRINTAPDNWVTRTAIRRGFKLWTKMNRQAMEGMPGTVKPAWHDYKVWLNQAHVANAGAVVHASDNGGTPWPSGEWAYSQYVTEDPDGTAPSFLQQNRNNDNFYAHICGDHYAGGGSGDTWQSVGLIRSWIDSRPTPQLSTPAVPGNLITDPLVNLFDEADNVDEVLDNLDDDNDEPPYDRDEVPGYDAGVSTGASNLQRQAVAATSVSNPIVPVNGFQAICGLIQVHTTQSSQDPGELTLLLDVETQGAKV